VSGSGYQHDEGCRTEWHLGKRCFRLVPHAAVKVSAYDANDPAFDEGGTGKPPTFEAWFVRGDHNMAGVNLFVTEAHADALVATERANGYEVDEWLASNVHYGYRAPDDSLVVYMTDCPFSRVSGSLPGYDESEAGKAWFDAVIANARFREAIGGGQS